MIEHQDSLIYRLWFLFVAILIAANILLLSTRGFTSSRPTANFASMSNNPNVVTNIMDIASSESGKVMDSVGTSIKSGRQSVATAAAQGGSLVSYGLIGGVASVAHAAGHTLGLISNTSIVSALIRPADKTQVPVIYPQAPVATPAVQAASQMAPSIQTNTVAQWPLHGAITTQFGAPELPYVRVHIGLDISDGTRPGTTPVRPFKPGRVTQVVRSNVSLGNHIVVDHGGGVKSVYGHLYSISVHTGQLVDGNTILGYEGSTGASTGTHLHFEVWANGQPVDPHRYISGQP